MYNLQAVGDLSRLLTVAVLGTCVYQHQHWEEQSTGQAQLVQRFKTGLCPGVHVALPLAHYHGEGWQPLAEGAGHGTYNIY